MLRSAILLAFVVASASAGDCDCDCCCRRPTDTKCCGGDTCSTDCLGGDGHPIPLTELERNPSMHTWHVENDPVMGGRSNSSWVVKQTPAGPVGVYSGVCRIVPSLNAPGFTIALTEAPLTHACFPNVSAAAGLELGLRNAGGNVSLFQIAFCDSRLNPYRCQFGSFKANFTLPPAPSSAVQSVFVPWERFSDKWSAATGQHTADEPPSASSLASISQLQLWVEGVAGTFTLEVYHIRAVGGQSLGLSSV